MANNLCGIAFSVNYDTSQVDGAPVVQFPSSWLGTPGSDMITFYYVASLQGRIDIALARTNQMNRSGYGQIAELIIVIDDDITKREIPLEMNLTNAFAIDAMGEEEAIKSIVEQANVNTSVGENIELDFQLYPNPAHTYFILKTDEQLEMDIDLVDVNGRLLQNWQQVKGSLRAEIGEMTPGIYLVQIRMGNRLFTRKLVIQ